MEQGDVQIGDDWDISGTEEDPLRSFTRYSRKSNMPRSQSLRFWPWRSC